MDFKEINNIIQNTNGILENEFNLNSMKKSRQKDKYACISCKSSDALHLYSETNTCHCFSCGQTWNAISFIMEVQGIDYVSAIKYFSENYNLDLPIQVNTKTQVKKTQSKLEKKLKEYKNILLDREVEIFKKNEDDIYEKIRNINWNENLSDSQKEILVSELENALSQKTLELEFRKDFINNLDLDFMSPNEISEMLELEVINPRQKDFLQKKLDLLNNFCLEEEDRVTYLNYFYNLKCNEYINYSKFTPNVVVDVEKYIDENNKLDLLLNNKNSLLLAPTGSGKTFSVLNLFKNMEKILKKQNIKVCFVVPNATQVQQIQEEYKINGAWDNADSNLVFKCNTISSYTWDKFGKISEDLSKTIVVLDEIHQIYQDMYRKNKIDKMIENINKCKTRIDITATPNKLDFAVYDFILEYKQKIMTNYNVNVYKNICDNKILDIINNSTGKVSVFRDDIGYLESISKKTNKKYDIVNSSNKDSNLTFSNIVKNGVIGEIDLLLNTSVILAGVNIKEPEITDIIIIDVKDKATIKQYVARFRDLENVNVHIFNDYKEISKVYSIENQVKYVIDEVQTTCTTLNINRIKHAKDMLIGEDSYIFKSLEKDALVYKQDNIYMPDVVGIRNKVYNKYYKNTDVVSFVNLLEEYFCNINLVEVEKSISEEIKKDKKEANKLSKAFLEELDNHKEFLVGYYDIKKGKVKKELKDYLKQNKLSEEKVLGYVEKNDLTFMLNDRKVKKQIESYSDLVIKKGYTTNFAYKFQTMHNKTKSNFIEKINVLIYEEIYKVCKGFMNDDSLGARLYIFILDEFPLTTSYVDEDINNAVVKLYEMHKIRLTNKKFKDYLNYIYVIEKKRIRENESVHKLNNKYIKNISSTYAQNGKNIQNKKSQITVHKLTDYHTLESICKEYKFNDLDKNFIKLMMDKKIELIKIKKEKMQEMINIFI